MNFVYITRKISDVATKSTIFELKPLEPKKKFFFESVKSPSLERTALVLATKRKLLAAKKISNVATKPTIFEHTLIEPKKI